MTAWPEILARKDVLGVQRSNNGVASRSEPRIDLEYDILIVVVSAPMDGQDPQAVDQIQSLAIVSMILLVFQITWGLNYYRTPLNKTLNYDLKYDEVELTATLEKLIKTTNISHFSNIIF